ncbi:MAG TPA: methyltransferase [Streptosporangiales bacterium]
MPSPDADRLLRLLVAPWVARAVSLAARLRIPDRVAAGTVTISALAAELDVQPEPLARLLRALAGFGVLTGDDTGYALTATGGLLRSDVPGSLRGLAELYGDDHFTRAWDQLEDVLRTGKSGAQLAFGESVFDYLGAHPETARTYDAGMSAVAAALGTLPEVYDLSGVSTVVDLAGGTGSLLAAVLRSVPDARGVLVDLPHVAEAAARELAAAGLAERCTVVGGDIFERLPDGGDLYLLSRILHDWDDDRCRALLATCRAAIRPGGTLLVVERLVRDSGDQTVPLVFDLHMMVMTDGRERTEAEYRELLAGAGFEPRDAVGLPLGFSALPGVATP